MEQGNSNQNIPHSGTGFPLSEFLFPSSLPENNGWNLSQYPVSLYNSPANNPQSSFYPRSVPDQTLEEAFSGLNLSSVTNQEPSPYLYGGIGGGMNSLIGGDSILAPSYGREQSEVSLETLKRFQNNSRTMDFGVGHRYPTVGSENWERVPTLPNPTAVVNDLSYIDGSLTSCCHTDQRHCGSYLQSKKEWSSPLNSQFPIMPCSNSNRYFDSPKFGFRSNNLKSPVDQYYQQLNYSSLKDLGGMIVPLAKEKNACRILQSKFENPSEDEIDMVLSVVIKDVGDLMKDEFGNFFIQKLIAVCNEDQRTRIILSVTESPFQLMYICLDQFGTESVKKLLEYASTPRQISSIMQALGTSAAALAMDAHGHRVIQHCLLHFSCQDNQPIINDIANNCFMVAKHRSGCCVVQSCLVHALPEPRRRIIAHIIANAVHLAEDPYGNYVLQHMLGLRIPEVTAELLRHLEGYYLTLSCNKFGSHVVEKCLTDSGEEQSARIIMELLRSPDVSMLLLDPFGNFVIQSALTVAKGRLRNALLNLVQVNAPSLRSNLYGKKLLDRFDKRRLQKV